MNKKAFGGVASSLILFIAIIGVSTGFVIAIKNYTAKTQDSIRFQNDMINNQLKTIIEITNVYYNDSSQKVFVYLKNIGQTKIPTSKFDFYINNQYLSEYTVYYAANLSKEMAYQFPTETATFVKDITLESGTHEVKLVSIYGGVGDTEHFNT